MMTMIRLVSKHMLAVGLLFGLATPLLAQVELENAFPNLSFQFAVDIQHPNDGTNRLFVVEKEGFISVFENDPNTTEKTIFLDLRDRVSEGEEEGIVALAFHPDYANNGFFFITYTPAGDTIISRVARFSVSADPNVADPSSEVMLLDEIQLIDNHNLHHLGFGPDGYLYISDGDGGCCGDPFETAQDLNRLKGSILRVDIDGNGLPPDCGLNPGYTIPPDNPFVGVEGCDEIFAYGFRNPWRFSFDAQGRLWVGDVGQDAWEEITVIEEKGENHGWNTMEGTHCFSPSVGCDPTGLELPIWDYPHASPDGGFAVTGGFVYEGTACAAELEGKYIYGDFVTQNIWALSFDETGATDNTTLFPASGLILTAFGVDQDNELYATDYRNNGALFKFTCTPPPTGDVTVVVTPVNDPIVIPPEGGSFSYSLTVTNNDMVSRTVQVWSELLRSNGTTLTKGPGILNVPAGGSISGPTFTQFIPGIAGSGTYQLTGFVGDLFPTALDSDLFQFEKATSKETGSPVVNTWYSDFDEVMAAFTAGATAEEVPTTYALEQNYPNPFNPETQIRFGLPEATSVHLVVYDMLGRQVRVLATGPHEAGMHEVRLKADALSSGFYVYRLQAGSFVQTRKMLLLK